MSRFMGLRVAGYPPPHIKKTKSGEPRHRPNKYADVKPSDQKNTSGQKRHRREQQQRENERLATAIMDGE